MVASSNTPLLSIVIPTLNSGRVLQYCLNSIKLQKLKNLKIEILICDGGSTDNTLKIAEHYHCKVVYNPLKTAESGKAVGIKHAHGDYVALIDSDNILPKATWLYKMLTPFKDKNIIGSEPWKYTYRKEGGFIERYSALTGVNDPYALVANNFDRMNLLRRTWNGLHIPIVNHRYYQSFKLTKDKPIPSIGANGTIYRREIMTKYLSSTYLIDVDFIVNMLSKTKSITFAKVKCGIIHTYCESSIIKFIKKQNRRATDLYIYQNLRPTSLVKSHLIGNIKFIFYTTLVIPMLFDTAYGFTKKPDIAWLFHPVACIITLITYALATIKYKLGMLKPVDRTKWQQ